MISLTSPFDQRVLVSSVEAPELKGFVLSPEKLESLSPRSSAKRRNEFALGRLAARRALHALGFEPPPPVLRGAGREPLWPAGITGSITHAGTRAVAAIAESRHVPSIGIDLECAGRELRLDLSGHICAGDQERLWLAEQPAARRERQLLLFSAKEAGFKALYPLCRRQIGFSALSLRAVGDEAFQARTTLELAGNLPAGFTFTIGYRRWDDYIFTFTTLE